MADVRAFRPLQYAEPLEPVLSPPYDVLSESDVAELQARSEHNIVHLTRPGSDYAGARRLLDGWVAGGVLVERREPVMFVHETSFGDGKRRVDLIAALRLQPYGDRVVLPHERTHRGPKEDRLALLQATGVSLEPLWFVADGVREILLSAPAGDTCEFEYGGEGHRLRAVTDVGWTDAVRANLAPRKLLIADGHHRYETALVYSQELAGGPDSESRFTLALITDLADPGLVVLPTHRVLRGGVAVTGGQPAASLEETLSALHGRAAAGYYREGAFQVLPLGGGIPLVELHRQIIDNLLGARTAEEGLMYTRDAREAVRLVDAGEGAAAFFLDAPDLAVVLREAEQGKTMPQKATYFFPKPPSGMALLRLDPSRNLM